MICVIWTTNKQTVAVVISLRRISCKTKTFKMKSKIIKVQRRAKVNLNYQLTALINFCCNSDRKSNYWLKVVINKSKVPQQFASSTTRATCGLFYLFCWWQSFEVPSISGRHKVIKCTMHNLKISTFCSHTNQQLIALKLQRAEQCWNVWSFHSEIRIWVTWKKSFLVLWISLNYPIFHAGQFEGQNYLCWFIQIDF